MNKRQAKQRIDKLRSEIDDLRYRYHVLDDPDVSDEIYDSLTKELLELEEQYPEFKSPDSPTQRVGGQPLDKFEQIPHQKPMLSLNDSFTAEDLKAWIARISKLVPNKDFTYHLDLKMDGLACALIYENGRLAYGLTRGDGLVGENVTQNIRTIKSIPLRLRRNKELPEKLYQDRVEIRGEILLYKHDFEELNDRRVQKGLPKFMNPRNTAAGTIRQLDPKLVAKRPLKFHAYALLSRAIETKSQEYKMLSKLGFIVNSQASAAVSYNEILKQIDYWSNRRKKLPFNVDGLVISVNQHSIYNRLGFVGKAPRGAIAYKYPPEQATTKVKDIFISVGRTGAATPIAILEPVVIAGTLVQMATLHNIGEIHRKDIRIDDTVSVHKAGDIIPEVIAPLAKLRTGSEKKFTMPKKCPECGTELVRENLRSPSTNGEVQASKEAAWRCPNLRCPARVHNQITHFASKSALDIDGMGEKNVLALIDAGLISDAADIFNLKKEQLLKLDRFAEVSAAKLIKAIHEAKNPDLARFIYGLGIRHIGTQTAIDLANQFHSLEKLSRATMDDLQPIDGIGDVVAEAIITWFAEDQNQKLLAKFAKFGVAPKEVRPKSGKLKQKSFVITGTLDSMSRDEAADKIRNLGGIFQSSVNQTTTYLIIGDQPGASKLRKAQQYGIKQLDEKSLLELLG